MVSLLSNVGRLSARMNGRFSTKMHHLHSPSKGSDVTVDLLERDEDELTAQATTRTIPVVDSKYLHVWQRALTKIKAELMFKHE